MPILRADDLAKTYARRKVVDGVSLEVNKGEIVGLLGPNGAGKTTTFRMICGMVSPDQGSVWLQGNEVTKWPMYVRAKEGGMGYLPQQASVFAKLTTEQNILAMLELLGINGRTKRERCNELLEQFQITKIRKSIAGKLSGGERRRLEIARCLVSNPEIIMLDEPFAGIDPVTVQNIQVIIQQLRDAGIAILITDHAAREILQITDRTYVVSEGRILCSGSADEIISHPEVKSKYLGDIEVARKSASGHQPNADVVVATNPIANRNNPASVSVGAENQTQHHSQPRTLPRPDGVSSSDEAGNSGLDLETAPQKKKPALPLRSRMKALRRSKTSDV